MLHIQALRGFVPTRLVVDTRGFIPLPGDEIQSFLFFWSKVPRNQRHRTFSSWCFLNVSVIGETLVTLSRWKVAIDDFEKGCLEERLKLELWHSEVSDIDTPPHV